MSALPMRAVFDDVPSAADRDTSIQSPSPPAKSPANPPPSLPAQLQDCLQQAPDGLSPASLLTHLVDHGLDVLPLPGQGSTLERWRALAAVAAHDLSLAKLYEGHTDALAILAELNVATTAHRPGAGTWGVWASEAPGGRTTILQEADGRVVLGGAKYWCSGAASARHALVTAWFADGRGPQLVHVALQQPGLQVDKANWHAVGMAGSASFDVRFADVAGTLVGGLGSYIQRPGFWHGGAGIAACWYGGAVGLAKALRQAAQGAAPTGRAPLRMAALGKVDLSLARTAALLREAAAWIDLHPHADASAVALRVRLAAEDTARSVLDEVGRALGAGPLCRDAKFAQAAADLPVFIRQSHAERDFGALADRLLAAPDLLAAHPQQARDGWDL